ncbi:heme oxygenase (biliverdin-producing) [Actinotalea sp. Marseille-Q4924]|uniref:biliverdin-producing heme oxygenase n=1 Tax=Actinotalea sp. Marseille-Q4924 TaxID=2866571 RepID=UPI001CE40024|nr:biliverdin-producing heme oxygenase [Actinotalea sp. Marseille-Q4924]
MHDTTTITGPALSAALRAGTRAEHAAAKETPFVEHLLNGRLDLAAYTDLAVQQHAIYTALESAGDHALQHDPDAAGVVLDELRRVPSIEADLHHLLGPQWRSRARVLDATRAYADRLLQTGSRLTLWVAHAYTRYLGDLSGGQAIHRALQRHYGLADDGLSFYRFTAVPRLKPLKDLYRERLDALPLTTSQRRDVVAEAQAAFRHNRAVLAALGARHPGPADAR